MVNDVRKINVEMRKIIATRCDICTYVFVRTYKIRTMETIVSINIGSVPDAYSARNQLQFTHQNTYHGKHPLDKIKTRGAEDAVKTANILQNVIFKPCFVVLRCAV